MARNKGFQKNNLIIFAVILLISLGSLITSKYTAERMQEALSPGFASLYKPEMASAYAGKNIAILLDENSFYNSQSIVEYLESFHLTVTQLFVPADSAVHALISAQNPNKNVSFFRTEKLSTIQLLVYDLQHLGMRDEPYEQLLKQVLEVADKQQIKVIISDRGNLFTGKYIDGLYVTPASISKEKVMNGPLFHGLTVGEFAHFLANELYLSVEIDVLVLELFHRNRILSSKDVYSTQVYGQSIIGHRYIPIHSFLSLFTMLSPKRNRFQLSGSYEKIELHIPMLKCVAVKKEMSLTYEIVIDSYSFESYFEFFYKFTQFLIRKKYITLTKGLEQRLIDFIGSDQFTKHLKNGDSWILFKKTLDDDIARFYDASSSVYLYR